MACRRHRKYTKIGCGESPTKWSKTSYSLGDTSTFLLRFRKIFLFDCDLYFSYLVCLSTPPVGTASNRENMKVLTIGDKM